jgi:hypothetical protein
MRGSENTVPENGAQSKAAVRLAVMMQQMTAFNALKPTPFEIEEVRCKMHEVVNHVPECEAREEPSGQSFILKYQKKQPVEQHGQRQVNGRWHYQSHAIVRIIVMDSVCDVVDLLAQWRSEFHVEEETVNAILHQCPEGIPSEKQPYHQEQIDIKLNERDIEKVAGDRNE